MFVPHFYQETTRRYITVFGTLFNNLDIIRKTDDSSVIQKMKVPLNYGPMQKYLSKLGQDPTLNAPAITLPRISFECVNYTYDGQRKLTNSVFNKKLGSGSNTRAAFTAAPYDLEFQLNIMVKNSEDGLQILEQILPFFKPEFTVSVKLFDEMDIILDIPIVLNNVSSEDTYEGAYEERRAIIWTLNFTLKGYYLGPSYTRKVIKFATANMYNSIQASIPAEVITVRPGLTANGTPTTNANTSIPWQNINFGDDWAYIVKIEDYNE
jgi:hypothetical protein